MRSRAPLPAMGWNSWNAFRCYDITEDVVLANADSLLDLGLADAGYRTVVVDDGWQAATRARDGRLESCPERFPHGMAWLGEQLHARGLRFGLYLAPGRRTCAQIYDAFGRHRRGRSAVKPNPAILLGARLEWVKPAPLASDLEQLGSYGREREDLSQVVDWGVDYLKYDWCRGCCGTDLDERSAFTRMSRLIDEAPREIVYSISEYGRTNPWDWAPGIANSWRTTPDISASARSIFTIARASLPHLVANRSGAVGDPDMLHVGNLRSGSLARTHMRLWGLMNAPLFIGTDLRELAPESETVRILKDRAALELDQAAVGEPARFLGARAGVEAYEKRLPDGVALLLANTRPIPRTVSVPSLRPGHRRDLVDVDGRTAYRADAGRGAEPPGTARLPGYGSMVVLDSRGEASICP